MNALAFVLILAGAAVALWLLGKVWAPLARWLAPLAALGALWLLWAGLSPAELHLPAGFSLAYAPNGFGLLFAWLTLLVALGVSLWALAYPAEPELYLFGGLSAAGAVGVSLSGNLLGLFLAWELMSWPVFFLIKRRGSALKYLVFGAAGSYLMLVAALYVQWVLGTDAFEALPRLLGLGPSYWLLPGLGLLAGFALKGAVMPLHVWAPDAYADSDDAFTGFFSGALSKLGAFGYGLVLFKLAAGSLGLSLALAWAGALTALLGGLQALRQEDAKRLLAWSSVSQVGYIALGFGLATGLGVAGALMHSVAHAIFKALFFLVVAGVVWRTGTSDTSRLGGLITRMPFSFLTALLSGIALAGIPPTVGFPGKWLIYEAAVESGHPFLALVALAAGVTAFLYVYRFLATVFLGQLHEEHRSVKEVPWFQVVVYLLGLGLLLWWGFAPGQLLDLVSPALAWLGFPAPAHDLWSIATPIGAVNLLVTGAAFLVALVVAAAWFFALPRERWVSQLDNYTAGEAPPPDFRYHYAADFYLFIDRHWRWLRWSAERVWRALWDTLEGGFDLVRRVYTGIAQHYAWYIILVALGFLAFWMEGLR